MNKPRLIQIIKRAGIAETREEATKLIRSGRVKVNGNSVFDIYYQARPNEVTIDGKPVKLVDKKVYFLLNKPKGYSCQKTETPNVLSLFRLEPKIQNMLFTIGRLDVDTTGLIIVTNDGSIMHAILKPEQNIWKTYIAAVDKIIYPDGLEKFKKGVKIEVDNRPYICLPAKIEKKGQFEYEIKIKEGKKRQIRKMIEAVGAKCLTLKRTAIGGLFLPNVKEGMFKEVTKRDLEKIFQ
ncbi:rRNA pseudouridine synthase [Candidatus Woesearchaeota archaeon]|nr:rRNA pseudouridine synthase [Candidatus Woesearchaeota archaeon]